MARTIHFSILSLFLSGGAFACGVEPIEEENGQIPKEVQMAFDRSCASVGCHASGGQKPFLDSGNSSRIIGGSSQGSDLKLVVLGDVEKSYLALKMLAPDMLPQGAMIQGGSMPPSKMGHTEADVKAILDWIESGEMADSGL